MPALVVLFRAINVGGRSTVAMSDLRAMAARLGLCGPRTLLQSGNVVVSTDATDLRALEASIEDAARADLGVETRVIVRSADQWAALVAALPFPEFARENPSHLLVMPLRDAPAAPAEATLRAAIVGREEVAVRGTTAYLVYPDGIGRSKLTATVVERHLGTIGTGRNWTTVTRIAAALSD